MNRIEIAKPFLGKEECQVLREVVESGWLTQGPKVAAFEKAFAIRHGVKHAVAVTSCTTGLFLALKGLGIGPGDEVVVPAFTWVATANVVSHCGATPVFVDVDPKTFNLDPEKLPQSLSKRTKAIIPVHLFGLCADMDRIREVAPDIPLVEDAACATGASYKGRPAGSLGCCGVFSFHPRKVITTGEGGMVTTNDDTLAEKLNILRNHGASISEEQRHLGPRPYLLPDFAEQGYNFRMTDLQGAVGLVQLARLDRLIAERARWAEYYNQAFAALDWLQTPFVDPGYQHSWQAYVCLVHEEMSPLSRNGLMEKLEQEGIATRPGTHAVHQLRVYRDRFGLFPDMYPGALLCDGRTLALPLHNCMSADDFQRVVEVVLG